MPGVRVRERRVQSERADVSVERGVKLFPVVMSVPPCEERGSSVRRVVHTLSLLVEQRGQPQQFERRTLDSLGRHRSNFRKLPELPRQRKAHDSDSRSHSLGGGPSLASTRGWRPLEPSSRTRDSQHIYTPAA